MFLNTVKPRKYGYRGVIESVHIKVVSVLSGLNIQKMYGLSFPRDKANFRNNEVFALS